MMTSKQAVRNEAADNRIRAQSAARVRGLIASRDSLGFNAGDTNLYRYVGDDPTNATDPSGLAELILARTKEDVDKGKYDGIAVPKGVKEGVQLLLYLYALELSHLDDDYTFDSYHLILMAQSSTDESGLANVHRKYQEMAKEKTEKRKQITEAEKKKKGFLLKPIYDLTTEAPIDLQLLDSTKSPDGTAPIIDFDTKGMKTSNDSLIPSYFLGYQVPTVEEMQKYLTYDVGSKTKPIARLTPGTVEGKVGPCDVKVEILPTLGQSAQSAADQVTKSGVLKKDMVDQLLKMIGLGGTGTVTGP